MVSDGIRWYQMVSDGIFVLPQICLRESAGGRRFCRWEGSLHCYLVQPLLSWYWARCDKNDENLVQCRSSTLQCLGRQVQKGPPGILSTFVCVVVKLLDSRKTFADWSPWDKCICRINELRARHAKSVFSLQLSLQSSPTLKCSWVLARMDCAVRAFAFMIPLLGFKAFPRVEECKRH